MTTSSVSLLQYLKKLKENETDLKEKGGSFNQSSLFSAIRSLTSPNHPPSPMFEKIIEISTKLTHVIELILFCEAMLKKLESNESLTQNEEIFLEYISMGSKILEMTLVFPNLQASLNSKCFNYTNVVRDLCSRLSVRFEAFMNHMTYSSYHQRIVYSQKKKCYTKSGSPSKTHRTITQEDKFEIKQKEDEINEETTRLSDECNEMKSRNAQLLERLSQLSSLVSKTIEKFGLKDFSEISFYLSGFNSEQFNQFRDKFQIIHQTFQSLKTDIDAFGQHAESLRTQYLEEYNKPDVYLNKWNSSLNCTPFTGKQD
jgi:hypothetical protein